MVKKSGASNQCHTVIKLRTVHCTIATTLEYQTDIHRGSGVQSRVTNFENKNLQNVVTTMTINHLKTKVKKLKPITETSCVTDNLQKTSLYSDTKSLSQTFRIHLTYPIRTVFQYGLVVTF